MRYPSCEIIRRKETPTWREGDACPIFFIFYFLQSNHSYTKQSIKLFNTTQMLNLLRISAKDSIFDTNIQCSMQMEHKIYSCFKQKISGQNRMNLETDLRRPLLKLQKVGSEF